MTDLVLGGIAEPALATLVIGKAAEVAERGVELVVTEDIELPAAIADARDLGTIFGNLLDNAINGAASGAPPRWVRVDSTVLPIADAASEEIEIRIADSRPGVPSEYAERAFRRGWSTKPTGPPARPRAPSRSRRAGRPSEPGTVEVRNDGGAVFTVRIPRQCRAERGYQMQVGESRTW